jgi:hypothetical protein
MKAKIVSKRCSGQMIKAEIEVSAEYQTISQISAEIEHLLTIREIFIRLLIYYVKLSQKDIPYRYQN